MIILNNWFIRNSQMFSFTKNTYVYVKYNFFSVYSKNYSFLDKFILSSFLRTVSLLLKEPTFVSIFKNAFSTHAQLTEMFNFGVENAFLNRVLFLTHG